MDRFDFLSANIESLRTEFGSQDVEKLLDKESVKKHEKLIRKQEQDGVPAVKIAEPSISKMHPARHFGAISENLRD